MRASLALGLALIALATALGGCGRGRGRRATASPSLSASPDGEIPARASTGGEALLGSLPAGADLLLELDLARLRANPVIGALVQRAASAPAAAAALGVNLALAADADAIVIASYAVGTAAAATLTVVRGAGARTLPGAVALGESVAALGTPALLARASAARAGTAPSLASDRELLRLRALAMPEAAEGAALRATARLGFDARVAMAAAFELSAAPASLSAWADIVDDAALVAWLDGDDAADATRLAAMVERVRDGIAALPTVRLIGLARPLAGVTAVARGARVRVVGVIAPRRLARVVDRLGLGLDQLTAGAATGAAASDVPAPPDAPPDAPHDALAPASAPAPTPAAPPTRPPGATP